MPFRRHVTPQDEFRYLTRLAARQSLINRLLNRPTQLSDFERERKKVGAGTFGHPTLADICLGRIVGSVGRARDFTPMFLPRLGSDEGRWVHVRRAVEREGLPPTEVYGLGERYFVLGGHHRVSVMKRPKVSSTEAYVTKLLPT